MNYCDLSERERARRREITEHARSMVKSSLAITEQDETSLMTDYCGYFLQISFSDLHPLMVFCLAKGFPHPGASRQKQLNEMNLKSILGSHAINDEVGCYSYRATQWLDVELGQERFFEILDRCVDEAARGYRILTMMNT